MERRGLFELIREKYLPREVLYPGCSIHITPAFFFPYVVFVDQNPTAAAFFSNRDSIREFVGRNRKYRRTPHIQFIAQDFTQPLPVLENQFDLVLALFAGGIAKACRSYLRMGGLLLTNNHQNDAVDASEDNQLVLLAIVQKHQGKYRLEEKKPGESPKFKSQARRPKRYLRQTSGGLEYIENESYYIFKRSRPRQ